MSSLEVLATGPLATVQDLGRPGCADLGLGPGGAADRTSLRQVNRLLGNAEGAAAIEVTLGGLVVRARGTLDVALTGAACPATIGVSIEATSRGIGSGMPIRLHDGEVLTLRLASAGLRCYLGVRGGVQVPPVLGSRSTDLLAGVGPEPLAPGRELAVGSNIGAWPGVDVAPWLTDPRCAEPLTVVPGPRADWFTPTALRTLVTGPWRVGQAADRSAVVLEGPLLQRARREELPTEGMVRGALQVPPSGRPTVLMADHPVTGGYPVVAVLRDVDVDRLAQRRPGDPVQLRLSR